MLKYSLNSCNIKNVKFRGYSTIPAWFPGQGARNMIQINTLRQPNHRTNIKCVTLRDSIQSMTHLSISWVDRSWLCSHPLPLALPVLRRSLYTFQPWYHSIYCQQLRCSCTLLPSCAAPLAPQCGSASEGPESASTPSGCCWTCDRAWRLLDNRHLQEGVLRRWNCGGVHVKDHTGDCGCSVD